MEEDKIYMYSEINRIEPPTESVDPTYYKADFASLRSKMDNYFEFLTRSIECKRHYVLTHVYGDYNKKTQSQKEIISQKIIHFIISCGIHKTRRREEIKEKFNFVLSNWSYGI